MSAVEEIQAAIDKLSKLKAESNIGPWVSTERAAFDFSGHIRSTEIPDGFDDTIAHVVDLADAELIVTLHATIDTQLAILASALGDAEGSHDEPGAFSAALNLARAINGGTA